MSKLTFSFNREFIIKVVSVSCIKRNSECGITNKLGNKSTQRLEKNYLRLESGMHFRV